MEPHRITVPSFVFRIPKVKKKRKNNELIKNENASDPKNNTA